tara:strand:+ start:260 stop:445 length:186 start_codon:yes stop_codon:yes gene_type:complete
MKSNQQRKKKYNILPKYNGIYAKCKQPHKRYQLMANEASGNGKCWWIYNYVMATATYRGWK